MFKNIGGKIKTFAKVVAWIGIIASVIVGLVFGMEDEDMIIYGLLIAGLGAFLSWVSSFIVYGFGQIVENTDKLVALKEKELQ